MMQQLRANTKWIMLVTAVAFVGLMVFEWGMDLSGQSNAQIRGGEVGRVNGEPVTFEEFTLAYRALYDQIRMQTGGSITNLQDRDIEDAAWEQLVTEKLIQQELRRQGLTATTDEVRHAARYMPPAELYYAEVFQTDGQFDLDKYHQYLASPGVDPQLLVSLENYYRQEIPRRKLLQRVTAGTYVTDTDLWQAWRDATEYVSARFIRIDPAALAEAPTSVSDADITAYYRANRDKMTRPNTAAVRMVALPRVPTAADSAVALERANAIVARIRGGEDFAEIARNESSDPGSAPLGGELGSFSRGQMVAEFEEAAFSLPLGQVSDPVLSQFGYHIIEVTRREDDQATARHILVSIEMDEVSMNALLVRADSLELIGEREGFDAAARRFGLEPVTVEIREDAPFADVVGRADEAFDWAKWEAAPGDVSPVFETPDAFYMVELVEMRPAGEIPLAEARPLIERELKSRAQLEAAREVANAVLAEVRGGKSLDDVAAARGFEVGEALTFSRQDFVPGLGQANAAIGVAFGLRPGQISNVVEADGSLFIIEVTERQEADREVWESQKYFQRSQVMASMEADRWRQYLRALWDSAEIVDNRYEVLHAPVDESTLPAMPRTLF